MSFANSHRFDSLMLLRAVVACHILAACQRKNELAIEHEGQLYRLLATKNGKLLLNK